MLRHGAGVPRATEAQAGAEFAHQLQHPFPLGEDDDLHLGGVADLLEDFLQLAELGTGAVVVTEDIVRVADHAHHRQFAHELVEFDRQQRAAPGLRAQLRDNSFVALVGLALGVGERDEADVIGAGG